MDIDPTGNWDLTYMFLAGCGQSAGTATDTFTVTLTPDGYAVSASGASTTGTLLCTPDSCKLSAVFAWSDASMQYQESANMVLDADDNITGNGTVYATDGTTACNLVFTVTGSRS